MTIRIALHHQSYYYFDRIVTAAPHEIRLRPAVHTRTPVYSYSLKIRPEHHFTHWQQDVYGNFVARVTFLESMREIEITVDLIADMTVINPFDFFIEDWAEHYPFQYSTEHNIELAPFLKIDPPGILLKNWLDHYRNELPKRLRTTDLLVQINQRVQQTVLYLIRLEPGVQSCEETLMKGSGACRDSAWLLTQILRNLGIAARFVSGYLIQLVPDIKPLNGAAGPERDFTDLHAWCEAYIPGAGWVGLDATSGLLAGEGHLPLAVSALPTTAAPVLGMTSLCESRLDVKMTVTRIHEDPRVTKPYSATQWQAIRTLGEQIDVELQQHDVRLTQGGEPTFVAAQNLDAPEWNFAALGAEKWQLANQLIQRLQDQFASGGIMHFGQGKWYPGEPLPRWAIRIFWRRDNIPIWRAPQLIAAEPNFNLSLATAEKLGKTIAHGLGLHEDYLIPAFEDPWHALDTESRLPLNLDPLDLHKIDLNQADARQTVARQIRAGITQIVAYVLPLKAIETQAGNSRWRSNRWPLRQERLYLLPGDSPAGLRLPLASLPWIAPDEFEPEIPVDPFAERAALPENFIINPDLDSNSIKNISINKNENQLIAREIIHTALVIEIRAGFIYVFLPPTVRLESWLELLTIIEQSAATLSQALLLEGYAPPNDHRLSSLAVTPDPGVLEVNIHPAANWNELETRTRILYEETRLAKLATEKFMLDGRHIGTGGGHHITLGGFTAADSPFLRRPDLLASLLIYWQHHPALSYLFSGQFIGPTSQAPRVDEARNDNLYELEIALQQLKISIPANKINPRPWLIDRFLRHLLIDMTGNTHRAEFCIDKLYPPESATGRLGIIELRAFEMTPHYQMNLLQVLLVRALIAWFWQKSYQGQLIYWDTALHDRFMLPHFIELDLRDVIRDLNNAGYPFIETWFAPFLEFRFPRYGTVVYESVQLELRQAIEPWHVLSEEISTNGTARYVDSSVERLQIKVTGMTNQRHQVLCNGRLLPLHPTGAPGEAVAGVRFKAWAPPSALHPSIKIQTPLVFDLIDSWNHRAIGGCTYHVSHPGGRNYQTAPVNANEAEARRRARFWEHGHTPGVLQELPTLTPNPRFPMTLDLRWQA